MFVSWFIPMRDFRRFGTTEVIGTHCCGYEYTPYSIGTGSRLLSWCWCCVQAETTKFEVSRRIFRASTVGGIPRRDSSPKQVRFPSLFLTYIHLREEWVEVLLWLFRQHFLFVVVVHDDGAVLRPDIVQCRGIVCISKDIQHALVIGLQV